MAELTAEMARRNEQAENQVKYLQKRVNDMVLES